MSIRPVDMQVVMPRSVESASRASQENARPNVAQHQFEGELRKQTEVRQQTVANAYKPDEGTVDKDGRRGSEREEQKKKRRSDEAKKNGTPDKAGQNRSTMGGLDILI